MYHITHMTVWSRDLDILVQCFRQLSYEATDVRSWSCVLTHHLPPPFSSHRNREVTSSNPVEVLTFSGFYTQLLKVPLKRNFRMWDFCLVIKFEPYLETLPTFFGMQWAKTAFSAVRSWPVELKMGGHLSTAKATVWRHWLYYSHASVSYTHLTLPTNREV